MSSGVNHNLNTRPFKVRLELSVVSNDHQQQMEIIQLSRDCRSQFKPQLSRQQGQDILKELRQKNENLNISSNDISTTTRQGCVRQSKATEEILNQPVVGFLPQQMFPTSRLNFEPQSNHHSTLSKSLRVLIIIAKTGNFVYP